MEKEPDVQTVVRQIKRSFRLYMNGEVSHSMREKGAEYGVNWGIELPRLRSMAATYEKSYDLACELWKSKVRECKVMATLLLPPEQLTIEQSEQWVATLPSLELAELCAMNVFQHHAEAETLAYRWIARREELTCVCGFHLLSRLIVKGHKPSSAQCNAFAEALLWPLNSQHIGLRRAAYNCAIRFIETSEANETLVRQYLKKQNLDIL